MRSQAIASDRKRSQAIACDLEKTFLSRLSKFLKMHREQEVGQKVCLKCFSFYTAKRVSSVHSCRDETRLAVFSVPFPQNKFRTCFFLSSLTDFELMTSVPDEWQEYAILGLGSHEFLRLIIPKLRHHVGPFILANDMAFNDRRCSDVNRLHRSWAAHDYKMGLESTTVRHANFGGITSAVHGISFKGVDISIFTPSAPLPRTLRHVLSDATPDATQEISAPTPLTGPQPRAPIYIDGMMRHEGLSDIGKPTVPIACPCVFKPTGWGRRSLSAKELLRAFDVSPLDDAMLLTHRRARMLLQRSITPLVMTTICRNLWNTGGGNGGAGTKQDEVLPSNNEGMAGRTSSNKEKEDIKAEEDTEVEEEELTQDQELLSAIKKAHDLA